MRGVHGVEPDNRYYTKANFFSMRKHSRDGTAISEKYQTDAETGEQEVVNEMIVRRNRI